MTEHSPQPAIADLEKRLYAAYRGSQQQRMWASFILFNLAIVLLRPQNDLKFLETIKFPFLVSLFPIAAVLLRLQARWLPPMKAMAVILALGAFWVPLAVNNFWAYQGWRTLLQTYAGVTFPIILYLGSGVQLRRLLKLLLLAGCYLGVYAITHGGTGPGDYMGDENDLCLVLAVYIGITLMLLTTKAGLPRAFLIVNAALVAAGIVMTKSRGGFLGFVAVLAYLIYRSPARIPMIFVLSLLMLAGVFVVPSSYWAEMRTIKTSERTAQERFEYWKISWRMFKDPKNIVAGVGMKNFAWRVIDYQPVENVLPSGKSRAGRAVHSLYFELMPELGLIGIACVIVIVSWSFRAMRRCAKECDRYLRALRTVAESKIVTTGTADSVGLLRRELTFLSGLSAAVNTGWIGLLMAGAFISVFYYPTIWLLTGIAGAVHMYWLALRTPARELIEQLSENVTEAQPA